MSLLEKKKGDLDNIPISMKYQPNGNNLHPEDILLTCRAEIPSIVDTLNKIIIPRDVYNMYLYHYYYDPHVEFLTWSLKHCQTAS